MNLRSTIANGLWGATNLASYAQFSRAIRNPERAQTQRLKTYLEKGVGTSFGRDHHLDSCSNYAEFIRRVPVRGYDELHPWIEELKRGQTQVLTRDLVTRLVPTSGSSGGRKLIPFTAGLQQEFNAAIGPWLVDLWRRYPGIVGGPAYWSVTPIVHSTRDEDSTLPIGFEDDTAYLGGTRQRLAREVMAVPGVLRTIQNVETFRYVTLLCLLRHRDLRLISVWHPSFLTLLMDSLEKLWDSLVADVESGCCSVAAELNRDVLHWLHLQPQPRRALELRQANPRDPESLWPSLKIISCWGDAAAEVPARMLQSSFPNIAVQPKGLLATEACVTLPFGNGHPVAVRSHFFEFLDDAGEIHRAHELKQGAVYEVIVTTGGGLWRYRLGDRVLVTAFVANTPSLRFLGRGGKVSDLRGEKLTETFVTESLKKILRGNEATPRFLLLAPDEDERGSRYTLYVEGVISPKAVSELDATLRQNPHYAYCRDIGQLLPIRLFVISGHGYEHYARRELANGGRLGNLKPAILSRASGWSEVFEGTYVESP